jgi:hypothetical protein
MLTVEIREFSCRENDPPVADCLRVLGWARGSVGIDLENNVTTLSAIARAKFLGCFFAKCILKSLFIMPSIHNSTVGLGLARRQRSVSVLISI